MMPLKYGVGVGYVIELCDRWKLAVIHGVQPATDHCILLSAQSPRSGLGLDNFVPQLSADEFCIAFFRKV